MATVRFFGAINDYSGYGNAVKNFAQAFSISNVRTKFILSGGDSKSNFEFIDNLNNYKGPCDVDFYLHCPPYSKHKSNAYKIGYFYWEADRLPRLWGRSLNVLDEIWVPCKLVKDACLKSQFRGPIKIVPTPCSPISSDKKLIIPSSFSDQYRVGDGVYKFYSIFQWHTRKGYRELLNAYYKTFEPEDNVLLILKVNPLSIAGNTVEVIKTDIWSIKRKLNLKHYPPVYLSTRIVGTDMIQALHNTADCYVSPHHGEGWGMPIHDAMQVGNQIITTRFGGIAEHLTNKSAHLIKYNVGPVADMKWSPLYEKTQNWAHPSVAHLMRLMKNVYENQTAFSDKSQEAKRLAQEMDIKSVSKIIEKELKKMEIGKWNS